MEKFSTPIHFASPRAQYLSMKDSIDLAVSRVLNSESYILGDEVSSFETEFSNYLGRKFSVGVNSGTDALILSMRAMDIGPGDEVIVPSFTALATVAAISTVGATPVLIDINPLTFTLDVSKLESLRTKRTKAVIAVHLYGNPAEMDLISIWCSEHQIELIEDCAQAHGAVWQSRKVGTFGKIACFSFYPTKNLGGVGDGGGIATDDQNVYQRLLKLRQYGWNDSRDSQIRSNVSRLDEIQAAILRVKLERLDALNESRIRIAHFYFSNLDTEKYVLPIVSASAKHVFHLYVVRVKNRTQVLEKLEKYNVFPGIHYKLPVHLNQSYNALGEEARGSLLQSEIAAREVISLPMYPEMSDAEISFVIEVLNSI